MIETRFAKSEDRPEFIRLVHGLIIEGWFKDFQFDGDAVGRFFDGALDQAHHFNMVAEKDGRLVGIFFAMSSPQLFGPDITTADICVFIEKQYRGTRLFGRLVDYYEFWARRIGAKEIHLGISTYANFDRTVKLYRKLGYHSPTIMLRKKVR